MVCTVALNIFLNRVSIFLEFDAPLLGNGFLMFEDSVMLASSRVEISRKNL